MPKPVAWALGVSVLLGAIFMGVLYQLIGAMGAGALAILLVFAGVPAWSFAPDKRTRHLFLIAVVAFIGRRLWDMMIATGVLPWTADAPGDAAAFTPVASYEAVRDFVSPQAQLVSLKARNVGADGTVDVTACELHSPAVVYSFLAPRRYPMVESTEGAPRSAGPGAHLYEVELHRESQRHLTDLLGSEEELEGEPWPYHWGMSKSMSRDHRGVPSTTPAVIPDPTCHFVDLWKQALAAGQPRDAQAEITYDAQGYHLRVGEDVHLRYNRDCALQAIVRLEYMLGGHRGYKPELFINGEPAGVMEWIYDEGNMRMLWLDPGEHTFEATLEGQAKRSITVRVKAGEYREVEMERRRRAKNDD